MKDNSSIKRVRFNSVEEVLELPSSKAARLSRTELLDSDGSESEDDSLLERLKPRRGAVNLDGYGSDASSDEDKTSKKSNLEASQKVPDDLDEDDMFGDSPDCKTSATDQPKDEMDVFSSDPKAKGLLSIDDINGQEDSDMDSDVEGGVKIEAFNLKDDMQEGKFDAQGNFVWNAKDPDELHDSWLKGISKSEMVKAKLAKEKQLERQAQLDRTKSNSILTDDASISLDLLTEDEIKLRLINIMQPQESVLGSLSRLGGGSQSKRKPRVNKNRAKKEALENPVSSALDLEQEAQRKKYINQLTEIAAHLLDLGHLNIYQETYESLVRSARISGLIPDDWIPGTPVALPK